MTPTAGMARRDDTPSGAWFVARRMAELDPTGPGAVSRCGVCGAEVWVEADDAGLAQTCSAIACTHCTDAVDGVLFTPPASRDPGPPPVTADPPPAEVPRCSGCGEPIEPHEPAWLEDEDGAVRPSSLRTFGEGARRSAWRLWHVDCYTMQRVDSPD